MEKKKFIKRAALTGALRAGPQRAGLVVKIIYENPKFSYRESSGAARRTTVQW
jgi:hypothetical protein